MTAGKLWGGRFSKSTDSRVEAYTSSLAVDRRLAAQDIRASIAHATMLGRQGIIPADAAQMILQGLETIQQEIERGDFIFREDLEDIHTNIEVRLTELIGDAAGWLHTARSRNDQVATDLRLYAKDAIQRVTAAIRQLQHTLVTMAEAHLEVIMPGYTHLQRAQPVLFSHHLLAYFEMFDRDHSRFRDALSRTDVSPLGAGALAGAGFPIDPHLTAELLGFSRVSENSLDAVSDRDFVAEFQAAAAICMMHISRLAEELILWSTAEFGFITLDDAFSTGSSIMPQKRNPDIAEIARARAGRVYGNLMEILTILKGLPLSYNRDLQQDKAAFFETEDLLLSTLDIFSAMLPTLRVNDQAMRAAAVGNFALATDYANYLTARGLPFREAHRVVGHLVRYCEELGKDLSDLTLAELRHASPLFGEDAVALGLERALAARSTYGGTGTEAVRQALQRAKARLLTEHENGRDGT
jgi:argininosuccinate lyase